MTNELRIRKPPLRRAGQSLDELASHLWNDKLGGYIGSILGVGTLIAASWLYWFLPLRHPPYLLTIFALLAIMFIGWRMFRVIKQVVAVEKGSIGERIVADALDQLRSEGYQVFNDIIAHDDGVTFNLDHVLVGTNGIYVVETKMRTKEGDGNVYCEGGCVRINGFTTDEPLRQAKGNARWLSRRLREMTGKDFFVRPVVLYPGWFIKNRPSERDLWVLNERCLPGWLARETEILQGTDVALLADRLGILSRESS